MVVGVVVVVVGVVVVVVGSGHLTRKLTLSLDLSMFGLSPITVS